MSWLFYGYRLNPIETLLELLPGVVCTRCSSSKTVQNPWNSKRHDFRDPTSLGFSLLHYYRAVYYRTSFYLLDVWKGVARWGEVLGCPLSCRTQRGGRHDNLLSTLRLTVWSPLWIYVALVTPLLLFLRWILLWNELGRRRGEGGRRRRGKGEREGIWKYSRAVD